MPEKKATPRGPNKTFAERLADHDVAIERAEQKHADALEKKRRFIEARRNKAAKLTEGLPE
jgi:hypothetical protein